MSQLKLSTNRNVHFYMTDSTDHVSAKTGLVSFTVTQYKDGAVIGTITPVITELSFGWYSAALTTTHTGSLGDMSLHIAATGADSTDINFQVVTDLPGASVSSVTGTVSANLTQILGTALTETAGFLAAGFKQFFNIASPTSTMNTITTVSAVTGLTASNLDTTVSSRLASGSYTAPPSAATIAQAVWDALTAALTTANSIGAYLLAKIDVVLSTRLATTGYTAPDNADIVLIKAKTDNIPAIPASQGDVTTVGTAVAAISTKIGTPVSSVSADIAAVKTDVDAIPITPVLTTHFDTIMGTPSVSIAADIAEIEAETDGIASIPTNPLLTTDVRLNHLDADVSSRLPTSSYVAPDNADILLIKAKTDNLPSDPASESLIIAATNSIKTDVDAIPTNPLLTTDTRLNHLDADVSSRLPTSSYVGPDNADVLAIKAKTDNLPAVPASQGDVITVGTAVTGIPDAVWDDPKAIKTIVKAGFVK